MTLTKDELLKAIETKSDQLNADDFIAGPRVFEIAGVSANATGDGTQPWNVRLAGQSRFYRPNKGFRRGLVKALGEDCASWVGKKIELYTDPSVTFGNEVTGGIKIGALSGIEDPVTIDLLVKRRRVKHTIRPLSEQDGAPGSPPVKAAPAGGGVSAPPPASNRKPQIPVCNGNGELAMHCDTVQGWCALVEKLLTASDQDPFEVWNANSPTHTKLVQSAKSEDNKASLQKLAETAEAAINGK